MPISAPRPSSPPSLKRVLALTMTAELSTSATNRRAAARSRGEDGLGVARAVPGDVGDGRVDRVDDGDGEDLVEVFGVPVAGLGGDHGRHERPAGVVAAELDPGINEGLRDAGEEAGGGRAVDEQGLDGVADPGALGLGVDDDADGRVGIDACIDVDVAVAGVVFQDGHPRLGGDAADQALAAAGDGQVDELGQAQQVADGRAVGGRDELDGRGGEAGRDELVGQDAVEGAVRVDRLLAAAEDGRVAALDAERGGVERDVRPALVDHEDDAEGDPDLGDVEAVGPPARGHDFTDRVGQRGDVEEGAGHVGDPLRVQGQAIDGRAH